MRETRGSDGEKCGKVFWGVGVGVDVGGVEKCWGRCEKVCWGVGR